MSVVCRTREVVVPALVDKCFGSSRQATKQKAISLALDYIEVENNGEGVVVSLPYPYDMVDCSFVHDSTTFFLVWARNSQKLWQPRQPL